MTKKIIGVLFFALAALDLFGAVSNGTFESDRAVFTIVSIILYLLSGLFFITFDNVYKKELAEGFKTRQKQNLIIILFTLSYAVLVFLAGVGAGVRGAGNYLLAFVVLALPYFLPLLVFSGMLGMYVVPFNTCKKQFGAELPNKENLKAYTEKVMADDRMIFFPRYFCCIPFEKIESVKHTSALEQDIVFTLKNKKKLELVANKKQYKAVLSAIENKNAVQGE